MKKEKIYIVSLVAGYKDVYYCHHKDFPNIPVFGSIGDKTKANNMCKLMNNK